MTHRVTRPRRATSVDVAREAGVSRTTVSFVLNNTPHQAIPEETRRRVVDAAARLSYRPSAEARALRRGRTDLVLLYLPSELPVTEDVGELVEHLAAGFAAVGLTLVAHPWTARPASDVWAAISPVAVVAWSLSDSDADRMRMDGVLAVTSLTGGDDPIGRWVQGPREDEIAATQVDRLLAAGHRRLGYALPLDERMTAPGRLRLNALRQVCAARGLSEPLPVRITLDGEPVTTRLATWLQAEPPVTGVCAHDTTSALAVLAALRRAGRRVPADLAVIGVNDAPAAALSDPPLTMVAIDTAASARYIVDVVHALLNHLPAPAAGPSVVSLRERASV